MSESDLKTVLAIYKSYERRKTARKKAAISLLFGNKKWYQFWKA
jgi:hypothetical protein